MIDLAAAYSALATAVKSRAGQYLKVEDQNGKLEEFRPVAGTRVISKLKPLISDILSDNSARLITFGLIVY
jgi:hypothetical protein